MAVQSSTSWRYSDSPAASTKRQERRGGAGGQKGGWCPLRSSASQMRVKTTNLMHSPTPLKPKSRQPPLRQSRIDVGRRGESSGTTATPSCPTPARKDAVPVTASTR